MGLNQQSRCVVQTARRVLMQQRRGCDTEPLLDVYGSVGLIRSGVDGERTSQVFQLEGLDVRRSGVVRSGPVVMLNEVDEVQDCEHARKAGLLAVPERGRHHTWDER